MSAIMHHSSSGRRAHPWPPLVYLLLGVICCLLLLAGTTVQVQTSEMWIGRLPLGEFLTFNVWGQCLDLAQGRMPMNQLVPFCFAWGVQGALLIASIGVELPKDPRWRYNLSAAVILLLIAINSTGDFQYAASYGFWGQLGFTIVVLFDTFTMGLFTIMCFMHFWEQITAPPPASPTATKP